MNRHACSDRSSLRLLIGTCAKRLLVLALLLGALSGRTGAQSTGGISGTVTDAATGAPLQNVPVRANNASGSSVGSVTTNASGVYTKTGLGTGTYYLDSNPRVAEFDPSPDHREVLDGGHPAVLRYELEVYLLGASAPFTTVDMGKPAPDPDGKVRYNFASEVAGWPLPGGTYEARVSAVGPWGAARSDPSNPFTFATGPTCTISLSATTGPVPASGGTYAVDVSTDAGCEWAATTALPWVTLWTAGGSGSGTAPFAVQANSSSSSRTGTIEIGGQTLTLRQDGAPAPRTTPTITWSAPSPITAGTPLGALQLNAIASVPGAFAYSPAAGTVLAAGTHTLRVTFTPADTTLYTTATASTALVVTGGATTGGTITGTVTDAGTGAPLTSVTVYVYNAAGSFLTDVWPNASGVYTTPGLVTGTYYLRTWNGVGYLDELYNDLPCANSTCTVTNGTGVSVTAGETTSGINFGLAVGGMITGTVTDTGTGVSLAHVNVRLYNASNNLLGDYWTNASGVYTTTGLLSGTYYVRTSNSLGYLDELYNDLPCAGGNCYPYTSGTGVSVTAGETTSGINFGLAAGGTITGTVTDAGTGAPLTSVTVYVYNAAGSFLTDVWPNASGVYTTPGLVTGTYYLRTWNGIGYLDKLYNDLPCANSTCTVTNGTGVSVTAGETASGINFGLAVGGMITGTVIDTGTGVPLADVNVRLYNASNNLLGDYWTNASGVYTTTGLLSGTYYVRTSNSLGYLDELYNDLPCAGGNCYPYTSGTGVSVTAGATTSGIDFGLAVGGTITGTVTDAGTGAPLADVYVVIYNASGSYASYGHTNASGVYAKTGLGAGTYYVRAGTGLGYVDEVYDNVPCPLLQTCTVTSGTGVSVTAGATTSGINFGLALGGTITGTVTDVGTGAPLANVSVRVYNASGSSYTSVTTDASGVYTKTGLATGTYYVRTSNSLGYVDELYNDLPCTGGACTVTTGTGVSVTAGATTNGIDFGLAVAGTVTGTVTDANTSAPLANVSVHLYSAASAYLTSASTMASGVFTVTGVPTGTYYVRTSNSLGYVDELYNDLPCTGGACTVTTGTGVSVTAGATTSGINFGLAVGGTVTGTVTDANTSAPLANVSVYVYSAAGAYLTSASTMASGAFTVTGVPTGTYYVRTSHSFPHLDELYNDVPCPGGDCTVTTGTGVSVTAGATTSGIDFGLALGGTITGTVTDVGTGAPLSGVSVYVYNESSSHVGSGYTNASGVYTKTGLGTGMYYVRTSNSAGYLHELYNDLPCPGGDCTVTTGTGVSVTAGATTNGIDFGLALGGTITGTVTDAGTGAPLANVSVRVYDASGYSYPSVTTNASGVYAAAGLATGTYYVRTSHGFPHLDELYNDVPCPGGDCTVTTGTGVSVTAGATTSGIDFGLTLGGTITGTVTDAGTGAPLANVAIDVYTNSGSWAGQDWTDASGVYTRTDLPAGIYYVRSANSGTFFNKVYDNLPSWTPVTSGTPIVVSAGGTTTANFALDPATGPNDAASAVTLAMGTTPDLIYSAGQAYDVVWYKFFVPPEAAGQDLKVNLTVAPPYPDPADWRSDLNFTLFDGALAVRGVALSGSGNETLYLHGVASGWYYIHLEYATTGYPYAPVARYAITLETGTNFGMGYISGRVVDGTGQGIEGVFIGVYEVPYNYANSFPIMTTGPLGTFSIAASPGTHDLHFHGRESLTSPSVNVVEEYYSDKATLAAADHVAVSDARTLELGDVTLDIGAIVTGQVTDWSGEPLASAVVQAYDLAGNPKGYVYTDASGNYTLNGVPVGGAKIRFDKVEYAWEFYDDQPTLGSAGVLTTQPGVTITDVDGKLSPGGSVSGTVRNSQGTGLSVKVLLYSVLDSTFVVASITSTAGSGNFTFTSVKPGDFKIFFNATGTGYAPEWYHDAGSFAGATGVAVRDGETTAGIDAVLAAPGGDFTGDLKSDVLWRHATRGEVWLWPMDGAARTTEIYVRTVADTGWEIRGLGDQDGGGNADVLWRHKTTGQIYLWLGAGSTPLSETYVATVDPAYDIVGTGDYDGDGKSDILWRHLTNGEVWIWLMDGATPQSQVYVGTMDPGYVIKGSGDLDGDHKADIVWHHATSGEVWVWLMDGTARLSQTWVATVPDVGYQIVGVADHSGDGKADLLWHHATRGEAWMWLMDGSTPLSETWVATVPDVGYEIVGTGDYNGDGKADILWHHATRGEVWVWLMDGATRLSQTWVATVPDVGYQIVK